MINVIYRKLELAECEYINNSASFNKWLKENAISTTPAMTLLDNSNLTIEEGAKQVSMWIDSLL